MATVEERINALETFELIDGQPVAEGPSLAIAFESFNEYNFVEQKAFDTKWTEEVEKMRQLVCFR